MLISGGGESYPKTNNKITNTNQILTDPYWLPSTPYQNHTHCHNKHNLAGMPVFHTVVEGPKERDYSALLVNPFLQATHALSPLVVWPGSWSIAQSEALIIHSWPLCQPHNLLCNNLLTNHVFQSYFCRRMYKVGEIC